MGTLLKLWEGLTVSDFLFPWVLMLSHCCQPTLPMILHVILDEKLYKNSNKA